MQVGDKVWILDYNRRQYEDDKGNKLDRCWFRYHFDERYIIGETNQSWIIGYKNSKPEDKYNIIKLNKKSLTYKPDPGKDGRIYTSEEQINQICWMHDNLIKIVERVRGCNDYNKLKKIEEILNS